MDRDRFLIALAAFALRVVFVLWAAPRFPPAADGKYYHIVASRIAQGFGYTWAWPDGAVTYAAHYPVGYPAMLGALYATFGHRPTLAMWLNAVAGAVVVWSVHFLASRFVSRRAAVLAAVVAALHPTLFFYTPAVMTELVSAALAISAVALASTRPKSRFGAGFIVVGIGATIGLGALVRPQQLLFAPLAGAIFALMAVSPHGQSVWWKLSRVIAAVAIVSAVGVGVCLPWTFRNCARMGQCVFVSANAGWNLLIGTSPKGKGAWAPVDEVGVPGECRLVFAEAAKDTCFGNAAKRVIRLRPWSWIKLAPAKLEKTFDDVGAPGYYLNASNWHHFDDRAKTALGATEVLAQRLVMAFAFLGLAKIRGRGSVVRHLLAFAAVCCLFYKLAWLGLLLYCTGVLTLGRRGLSEPLVLICAYAYGTTAAVHATFFGGARYAIVVLPFMIAAAATAWSTGREPGVRRAA